MSYVGPLQHFPKDTDLMSGRLSGLIALDTTTASKSYLSAATAQTHL